MVDKSYSSTPIRMNFKIKVGERIAGKWQSRGPFHGGKVLWIFIRNYHNNMISYFAECNRKNSTIAPLVGIEQVGA